MRAFALASLALLLLGRPGHAGVRVVTTTEDLAALVAEIGGPRIRVEALIRGDKDPIAPALKPAMVLPLGRADLLIVVGSGLEDRWLQSLIARSRNAHVQTGVDGYYDVSAMVDLLEVPPVPAGTSAPAPDVRPDGNPHYWLDPASGRRVAKAIRKKLASMDPGGAAEFARRYDEFDKRLAEGEKRWDEALLPYKGRKLAAWDRTWSYFANRYGLEIAARVEARPALVPTPERIEAAVAEIQKTEAKLLLVEPFVDVKLATSVASQAGARVLVLPSSVGGVKGVTSYEALFDEIVARLVAALR